jgi:SAM-dependent methyltransferase
MEIGPSFVRQAMLIRTVLLSVAEPIDWVSRRINHKSDWPPLVIRRHVGPLDQLENSGAEFRAYIKILCGVSPSVRMLDIGCGFGLMAKYLQDYVKEPGTYVGIDVYEPVIRWAKKHITPKNDNFKFIYLDIQNALYNPKGKLAVKSSSLPLKDNSFDFVLVKSVFTHIRSNDVHNYLSEIKRLLVPNGKCLATFFLNNDYQRELQAKGLNSIDFKIIDGPCSYAGSLAETSIGYDEKQLIKMIKETGLSIEKTYYGTWSGRPDGVSYQDMVIIVNK